MATNVPPIAFSDVGVTTPAESAIYTGVIEDLNAAFSTSFDTDAATPQGQIATSFAAIIGNIYDTFLDFVNQVDPTYSSGRFQDALGRLYLLERNPATATILQIICTGAVDVSISTAALLQDGTGNVYQCMEAGAIGSGGTVTLPFSCQTTGPIPVPDTVTIYSAVAGWDAVSIASGTVGKGQESRYAFEQRRAAAVSKNGVGFVSSIRGAVLAIEGVIDAYVVQNNTNAAKEIGGYTLIANSIYIAVEGGADADVAGAIFTKLPPGCSMNGNTTVTVEDNNSGYVQPYPSYDITFERPGLLRIAIQVTIVSGTDVPSDAANQIQTAIVSAFSGGDGGSAVAIGGSLYATRYVGPVLVLGSWAKVISIKVGSINDPAATFTGSISGTTLAVSTVSSGAIPIGAFVMDAAGTIVAGTKIVSGSSGTYTINNAQTVASETMFAVVAADDFVMVNIDQYPTISADDIAVVED